MIELKDVFEAICGDFSHNEETFVIADKKESDKGYNLILIAQYSDKLLSRIGILHGKNYFCIFALWIRRGDYDSSIGSIPIRLRCGMCFSDGGAYNPSDDFIKRKLIKPINLDFDTECSYDYQSKVYWYAGRGRRSALSAKELFDKIFNIHLRPTKPIRGFALRLRLTVFQHFIPGVLTGLADVLILLLKVLFGKKIGFAGNEIWLIGHFDDAPSERKIEEKAAPTMKFFDVDVNPHLVVSYSILHLAGFLMFYCFHLYPGFIRLILKYGFLTVIYVVSSMTLFDRVIPPLFKKLAVASSAWAWRIKWRRLHVQ